MSHRKASNVKVFTLYSLFLSLIVKWNKPWPLRCTNYSNGKTTKYSEGLKACKDFFMPTYLGLNFLAQLLGGFFWSNRQCWVSCSVSVSAWFFASISAKKPIQISSKYHKISKSNTRIIQHTHTHTQAHSIFPYVQKSMCVTLYHCISQNAKFGTSLLFSTRSEPLPFWMRIRFSSYLSDWSKCTSDDCKNAEDPPDLCGASEGAFKKPNKQIKTTISEVLSSTFLRIQPHSSFWLTLTCQQIGFSRFQNTWLCSSFCNTLLAFLKNSNLKLLCWGTSWRSCGPCFTLKIWGLRRAARFTALTYKWSMQTHENRWKNLGSKIGDKAVADLAGGSLGLDHETIPVWAMNRGWRVWWNCT